MRQILFAFLIIALVCGATAVFLYYVQTASAAQSTRAAVIADEDNGVIRFMIDGREAARLDATGFYVREDVTYGGALVDTGRPFIDDYMAGRTDAP